MSGFCLRALVGFAALTLSACTVQYHDLSQSAAQAPQVKIWGSPPGSLYLCLSIDPGTPVYGGPQPQVVIGYTRDVVAFYGIQDGQWVEIKYYNGQLGWVDGLKVRPYHGPHTNSTCEIYAVDIQQQPIFTLR